MKRTYLLFIMIAIFMNVNTISYSDESIPKTIRIAGDNRLPPYHYVNDNGAYKGFSVDVIHAVAIEMGIDVELIPMPFFSIEDALGERRIDMILGLEKRNEYDEYLFSDPYLTISKGIFVKSNNQHIVELEDIQNSSVIVQRGNVPNEIENFVNLNDVIYVDNQQQGILALMMGNADAFIGNRITGKYTIQKWKQTNFIKVVGAPIAPIDYCFATNNENSDMVSMLDEGLKRIRKNGTYDKIYKKWFGEILKTPQEIQNEVFKRFILGIGVIFAVVVLIFRVNVVLKREVKRRTNELDKANIELLEINTKIKKEYILRQKIINSVFHGIVTVQRDGTITFKNQKAEILMSRLDLNKFQEQNIRESFLTQIMTDEEYESVFTLNQMFMEKEKVLYFNGIEKVLTYSFYPIMEDEKNTIEAILLFKDSTKEKRMQEQLFQRDKMNALGEFMAVVAHEIRNPLSTIKTYVDLMPSKIEGEKFREKLLYYVPTELNRIEQLVTELLNYSKPTKTQKKNFEVDYLILEVIQLFGERFEKNNIHMHLDILSKTQVFADRNQVKQVLINLLLNSIQAINHIDGHITINTSIRESECMIEIIDNGKGIEQNNLKRIFEPYFTSKKSGTGLGLAICYQIIKEHGGVIDIQSEINEGTTVKIQIPRMDHKFEE